MAVGGAAPHLGAVGGGPGDEETLRHSRFHQVFANGHDALAAKTGNDNFFLHLTSPPYSSP